MKKKKISKNWLAKQKKDPFFKLSKLQGFRSRSAFKLIEMNKKFKIFKKKLSVLDLGSSPGGWSQVARREIFEGKNLAVDIKSMDEIKNVDFIKGNFMENEISKNIRCLVCNNQSIVNSNSEFAIDIKKMIREKLADGKNKNQIFKFLKSKYGDYVLFDPPFQSNTFMLWILPFPVSHCH